MRSIGSWKMSLHRTKWESASMTFCFRRWPAARLTSTGSQGRRSSNWLMWKTVAVVFVALGILRFVVTEVLRSVVDRRRRERDGLGGMTDCDRGAIVDHVLKRVRNTL